MLKARDLWLWRPARLSPLRCSRRAASFRGSELHAVQAHCELVPLVRASTHRRPEQQELHRQPDMTNAITGPPSGAFAKSLRSLILILLSDQRGGIIS